MKYVTAWLAKFYDSLEAEPPSRTALLGAADEDEAADKAATLMRDPYMRVDVMRVVLRPDAGVPEGEARWLD